LFDFVAGSTNTGNGTAQSTFYFDDVRFTTIPLSVAEAALPKGLIASPNPATDHWAIARADGGPATVRLYSINGSLLHEGEVGTQEPIVLNAAPYAPGSYILHVASTSGVETVMLQKK
jgi:hypothetical protein